ncbi:hypothetical protein Tsubulata_036976 [Turnera subulata]|uniref:Uncharacterized protein n=1 Tax=Turnera subulata TaxID=218843 RepID=A0A9Q0FTJ8_9ROSI|nr:hypothetical protein Tsubulata_036976 [Turnera subulata]
MAISPSPFLSPLRLNATANLASAPPPPPPPPLSLPPFKLSTIRRSTTSICSAKTRTEEETREYIERYGLDPKLFLPEPSSKSKRRKGIEKTERRKREPKPERTTHKLLHVLSGTAKRTKLISPTGMDVRPMMEVVKGSVFDSLQSACGCPTALKPGSWLDLYCGTGSVGIEALSRGCAEAHFVEMDPWVVSNCLQPNLESTGFLDSSVIHTTRVENFLERVDGFVGGDKTFDFISVTPPYTAVDYEILMGQISESRIVGENTFIVVEYPLKLDIRGSCGCLVKIIDRRFGRTNLAIYGPDWAQKKRKSKKIQSIREV